MKDLPPENDGNVLKITRIFFLLAIFLVLFVQLFLYLVPVRDEVAIPTPIWFGISGILIFLAALSFRNSKFFINLFSKFPLTGRGLSIFFSIGFSLVALVSSVNFEKSVRSVYIPISTLWLISAFFFIAAFSPVKYSLNVFLDFLKKHRDEIIAVSLITILALILRVYKLGEIPFVVNGDEGWIGMVTQSTQEGALANPFALWENFGAFYLHGIELCIKLFGVNPFALRLLPALGGVLAVPAVYLLARQIAGRQVALISAFLLACSHAHINFSRTVAVAYIQGTWLIPLELFFLLRGLTKRNSGYAAIAGVLLAIHYCIYLSSQVVTGLILVYMLILLIFYRAWFKTILRQLLVFWMGFLIVFLPEFVYIIRHPDVFLSRLSIDGTFQSGWLDQTILITGKSAVQILGERVVHAFLTLIYYPSIDFYGTQAPIFTFLTAALFLIGLGIVLFRTREKEYLLLNGYFWALTLAVGILALPPSADSYRMLAVLPAAVIISAVGLFQILKIMGVSWERSRIQYSVIVGIVLLSIFGANFRTYFLDFAGECKYGGDTQTRFSTHLGYFLESVNREATVYLLSDDIIFYGQNLTVDFLSSQIKVTNVNESVDTITPASGTVIIAVPSRRDELNQWAQSHPEGEFAYRYDCRNIILSAYLIP
jgi:4-amino-4-deoxy-L-arabinose transferase-like glycosyltransferase